MQLYLLSLNSHNMVYYSEYHAYMYINIVNENIKFWVAILYVSMQSHIILSYCNTRLTDLFDHISLENLIYSKALHI